MYSQRGITNLQQNTERVFELEQELLEAKTKIVELEAKTKVIDPFEVK